jgi:nanoRNase/pAp phosphatase (c-di-AMP/oligoRNAs hydrolase)
MALNASQQAQELITRAGHILVATREHPSVDTVASAVAMGLYLKALKKSVDIVVPGYDAKKAPEFLKGADAVQPRVGAMRTLEIKLDVSKTPIDEFLYDVRDGNLVITIVPKENEWSPNDVTFKHGKERYDLMIVLDTPDMKSLGHVSRDYADFLYRTTIVNIDANAANEHWGQVNIVNLNAVSTTEVLFELFSGWNENIIDEHIATALLAGMIAKTRSFRTPDVTPRTLLTSSRLVAMGAKRAQIVNGLWRTRSVSTLKLWGRALSRLHHEADCGLVWTMISHKDFMESGASSETLPDVIDELISYAPEAKVSVLMYENEKERDSVCVMIATAPPHNAAEIGRPLGATGTRDRVTLCLTNTNLVDAANSTIDLLKKTIKPV